jgi:hypothetical protein
MATKVIHSRWIVFLQALGLASAWAIAVGLYAGVIGVVAYTLTGGAIGS